ncbi:MAG: trimethylamine methyltransferase family protein [Chloroflexota bacterium]
MRTNRSRRNKRSTLRQQRSELSLQNFRFRALRNPLPPTEFLPEAHIEELHEASMHILENTGLDFFDDEAMALWEQAGAKVDHARNHVWLDRELVLPLVAQAPSSFTWRARNPDRNVLIGDNSVVFAPMGGMVYVSSLDMPRRPGTWEHLVNLNKLTHMCPMIHVGGGGLAASDVRPTVRHLRRTVMSYTTSDKATYGTSHGRIMTTDVIEMAKLVYGDPLPDDPVISGVVNVNSPLTYDERMLGGMITLARAGQIITLTPFILAGAMSPITIAAALAQQNAEALAGVALTQLVRPGAPVIYGGFTTNTDMKTGSPSFGTPEGAWAMIIGAQLARRYQLPYRGSGSLCSANAPDAQAAYETMWTLWPAVMAHTNLVNHSVGWLENGLTVSYEKLIMDLESLAMFYHFLEGFQINKETLALDMIHEIGPGGHHFGTAHTQARYSSEFFQPFMKERMNFETWKNGGGHEAPQRANAIWKELLANYEAPKIDPGIEEALRSYAEKRERELEGVDLYTG